MDNFKSALEKFLRNELERDELACRLEQALKQAPTLFNEIQYYLTKLHQTNRFSADDYFVLNTKIKQVDEETRLKNPISGQTPSSVLPSDKNFEPILEPGLVIRGNYRLEELAGKGGMSVVWKARDLIQEAGEARDSSVAIKFLSQDFKKHPDALKALVREFNRYKKLNHLKIVKAHNLDRVGNTYFMVMEFLKGIPLNEFIKNHPNGIPRTEAEPIIKDMGYALAHAHKSGIAHMDFKPANVFYNPYEKIAKVIDFGIARPLDQSEREKTRFDPGDLGALTELYASYEMLLDRKPDPRDDIYALACVTYKLLSGEHPFGRKKATTAKDKKLTPKPIKGLKRQQYKALLHGLAFEQNDRTPTAEQFLAELFPDKKKHSLVFLVVSVGVLVMGSAALVQWQPINKWLGNVLTSVLQIQGVDSNSQQNDAERLATEKKRLDEQKKLAEAVAEKKRFDEQKKLAEAAAEKKRFDEQKKLADVAAEKKRLEEQNKLADAAAEKKRLEEPKKLADAARCEQSTTNIIKQADEYWQVSQLIYPPRENALEKYQQALKLCPSSKPAQVGLAEIADFYKQKAQYSLKKGHKKTCQAHIENGLRAIPDHKDLLALKAHCQ